MADLALRSSKSINGDEAECGMCTSCGRSVRYGGSGFIPCAKLGKDMALCGTASTADNRLEGRVQWVNGLVLLDDSDGVTKDCGAAAEVKERWDM